MPKNRSSLRCRTSFNRLVNNKTEAVLKTLRWGSDSDASTSSQAELRSNISSGNLYNQQNSITSQDSDTESIRGTTHESDTESITDQFDTDLFLNDALSNSLNTSSTINAVLTVNQSDKPNIRSQIAGWAVQNNVPGLMLGRILNILKPYHNTLPSDPRTLLKTPRETILKDVEPGKYYHLGIEHGLQFLLLNSDEKKFTNNICEVLINIDGLPISASSSSQLYPILMALFPHNNFVTVIGLYHGYEKPKSANIFLRDLVDEAISLTNNGFVIDQFLYGFKIKGFVCDAPAKSFIKCVKGHTGYFSCTKCTQEGRFVNNRMSFSDIPFTIRSDDDFLNLRQEEHH